MAALVVYPFVEARLRNDPMPHQLLDLPREVPVRTGLGVAFFIFMFALFAAGSDDVQARYLHLPIDGMVLGYRIFCVAAPLLAFWITFGFAKSLQARGGSHKADRVRLTRTPEGGFEEETIA